MSRIGEKTLYAGKKIPSFFASAYVRSRLLMIFLTVLFLANAADLADLNIDMSIQKQGAVSSYTKDFFSRINKPLEVIYIASKEEDLSFKGKELFDQVSFWLDLAEKLNGHINGRTIRIASGSKIEENTERLLKKYDIRTFKLRTIMQDKYVEQDVYSSLIFRSAENTEIVRDIYPDEINRLEFTFVSAVKRLLDRKKPSIAVVTEEERLSPAEEFHDYIEQHRLQPKFQDYFSDLKTLLKNHGYDVTAVNCRSNNDFNADLMFVLQPRIMSEFMKKRFNSQLLSGKKAMVACQHYQIIPRRYAGRDFFGTVYWPRPYFTRINELLDTYGIDLKKEVLLDENSVNLDIKGQVRWGGALGIEQKMFDAAEPFHIRASAVNFNKESMITSQLSDQFFIFGNRFVRKNSFPENLSWEEQILTSPRVWAINWAGGFIDKDSFKDRNYFDKKQPLSVLVKGRFPALHGNTSNERPEGELLLTGNSVMFKNFYLLMQQFEHKNYLLNSIAYLTYEKAVAELQAKSFIPKKGFGIVSFKKKILYRFFIIFLPGILIACSGLIRYMLEKRRKMGKLKTPETSAIAGF